MSIMTFLSSVSPAKELWDQSLIMGTPKLVVGIRVRTLRECLSSAQSKNIMKVTIPMTTITKLLKIKRKMIPDRYLGIYKEIKSTENGKYMSKYIIHLGFSSNYIEGNSSLEAKK